MLQVIEIGFADLVLSSVGVPLAEVLRMPALFLLDEWTFNTNHKFFGGTFLDLKVFQCV